MAAQIGQLGCAGSWVWMLQMSGKEFKGHKGDSVKAITCPQITRATSSNKLIKYKSVCINNRTEQRETGEMQTRCWGRAKRNGGRWAGRRQKGGQRLQRDEKSMDKQVRGRLQKGSQRGEN